ncbi:MAG: hypothetical protein KAI79_01200 [Bacteroidales bacterium]|nr:hypothetical protein [Bacteroidales bacterium]
MKTYTYGVIHIATDMFDQGMSGAYSADPRGLRMLAYIFEKDTQEVFVDVKSYETKLWADHSERMNDVSK